MARGMPGSPAGGQEDKALKRMAIENVFLLGSILPAGRSAENIDRP
jgi:hypothetical protein